MTLHLSLRTPRRILAATLGLSIAVGLAACSSDDDSSVETSHEAVTVTHQYGTTEIPKAPKRVVVANPAWRDALIALDVPFSLAVRFTGSEENPWEEKSDADEITYTNATTDYPVEKIAASSPDVILGVPAGSPELYDQLSGIAPSIGNTGSSVDDWRQVLAIAGQVFDKEDAAARLEQIFDDKVSAFRVNNPGIKDKTFTFTALIQDQVWAVANPEDPLNVFFTDLGMKINPSIIALDDGQNSGRVKVSLENLDVLNSDAIIHQGNEGALKEVSGWLTLPAVKSGNMISLDPNPLNQPSILSVNWALDHLNPQLQKIAAP